MSVFVAGDARPRRPVIAGIQRKKSFGSETIYLVSFLNLIL